MTKVSFTNKNNPFFTTLKRKVNQYFSSNNIHPSGNRQLYLKGIIQLFSSIILYGILVFFTPDTFLSLILCALLGINLAVLGFNIMHEGGHQTFSKHKWLNTVGAYFLNILGGNTFFWKIKHNINHHTYTNIEGMDADINVKPFMRVHQGQPLHWIHRFQHLYCIILYGLSYFTWVFWDDFVKYFTGRIASGSQRKMNIREHFIFWLSKTLYVLSYVAIPILMVGLTKAIIGFAVISFTCGITIAIVFQLAHIVEGTDFPTLSNEPGKIEHEWAIHQVLTTSNFSTKNKIVSWILGGLNFQVEHHLFPRISHVHYPKINQFVRETCIEYSVPYLEHTTIFKAIGSPLSHLKRLGRAIELTH